MKKFLACLLVSASLFYACSDDSGSNSAENTGKAENQHIQIDRENKVILIQQSPYTEEACLLINGVFSWGSFERDGSTDSVAFYETRGDTLVVHFPTRDSDPRFYVGGSTKDIYGEWKDLNCGEYQGDLLCPPEETRKEETKYAETFLFIAENEFEEKIVHTPAYFEYDDYMYSDFARVLHSAIAQKSFPWLSLRTVFSPVDTLTMDYYARLDSIEILKKNKLEETFKVGGKTYEFKVTKVERDFENYTVAVNVSSGDKECVYEERQFDITESSCKELTVDDLRDYNEERDFQDSLYIVGSFLISKGLDDFNECIVDLSL